MSAILITPPLMQAHTSIFFQKKKEMTKIIELSISRSIYAYPFLLVNMCGPGDARTGLWNDNLGMSCKGEPEQAAVLMWCPRSPLTRKHVNPTNNLLPHHNYTGNLF